MINTNASKNYDVVIAGGALVGSAIAWFLASQKDFDGSILVIERDTKFQTCSSALSAGGIRQQFSTKENVEMSLYGADFLRQASSLLQVENHSPNIYFEEKGYLMLATERGVSVLIDNNKTQTSMGASVELLGPEALKIKFPWLNVSDLAIGSFGYKNEGWFDVWSLLGSFRRASLALGVDFIEDEVTDAVMSKGKVATVVLASGKEISPGTLVNAMGPRANNICEWMKIESLPVSSRKRFVFTFHCLESLVDCPLVVDPSGVYFRPDGDQFICGLSPTEDEDTECYDFKVDHSWFEERIWEKIASRVPAFETIKVKNSWAGHYAFNYLDQNAILGKHPECENLILANGFSGHGAQHAPSVGRGISELITYNNFKSIDLSIFSMNRFRNDIRIIEKNVI